MVVSTATQRLIQGFFKCPAMGVHSLKGIAEPMELFKVIGEQENRGRVGVVVTTGQTEMVGREQEIGLLLDRWPSRLLVAAGWLFTAGVVLFCGSLYLLALTGIGVFGAVAPVGGAGLMGGWGLLILSVLARRKAG